MNQSPEDLMKPRYEVIAQYPASPFPDGTILPDGRQVIKELTKQMCAFYDKYPHLFKRLKWWEKRKPEEMPEYVKYKHGNTIFKISDADEIYPEGFMFDKALTEHHIHYNQCLPATLLDYQKFINQKC